MDEWQPYLGNRMENYAQTADVFNAAYTVESFGCVESHNAQHLLTSKQPTMRKHYLQLLKNQPCTPPSHTTPTNTESLQLPAQAVSATQHEALSQSSYTGLVMHLYCLYVISFEATSC